MFSIINNFPLESLCTMATPASAEHYIEHDNSTDLIEILNSKLFNEEKHLILGGGSNVFFTENFNGVVLNINTKGINILSQTEDSVFIEVMAGEVWDDFVQYCCDNNFYGAENLSLIPGKVGASPVQNIGAYGVEVKDLINTVNYTEIQNKVKCTLSKDDCNFGYRDSIFKTQLKNKVIITSVTFELSKKPNYKLSYGSLKKDLSKFNEINLLNIREAVITTRNSKLPNTDILPNSGSFFKNPIIKKEQLSELIAQFPNLVSYPAQQGNVKLAAGQLIDIYGWKGYKNNGVGVHENQALVIINYINKSGKEIIKLAEQIKESVKNKFSIELEMEVNAI